MDERRKRARRRFGNQRKTFLPVILKRVPTDGKKNLKKKKKLQPFAGTYAVPSFCSNRVAKNLRSKKAAGEKGLPQWGRQENLKERQLRHQLCCGKGTGRETKEKGNGGVAKNKEKIKSRRMTGRKSPPDAKK